MQDKLFLPGLRKLSMLRDSGFFGRILSVAASSATGSSRATGQPAQRPSWNYRTEDGGGIILDMVCHWRYVLDNLFGEVRSVSCLGATHIPERGRRERRRPTRRPPTTPPTPPSSSTAASSPRSTCPGRRASTATTSSTFQVDGTHGSAVAGLQDCVIQPRAGTPRPVWNPDLKQTIDFYDTWQRVPDNTAYDNGFKVQWEMFIRHVVEDAPFRYTLLEGAKGVQLVEAALQSWKERRWVDVPPLQYGAETAPAMAAE